MPSTWPFPKPRIPDVEDRLPFIWRQFVDPCDAPITVWLNAFWPALGHALIAWFYVDLIQIFRTMWKPPLYGWRMRGGRHGSIPEGGKKRGFGHRFKKGVTFDVNDWVGKQLNPFADEEMVLLLPGEIWIWTGVEAITIFLFFWSVFDITTGFLYEWTSGVAMTKYCHARDDAVLVASAPGYPLLGIFGWDAVGILDAVKMRHIDFFNGFGVAQSVGPGVVALTFGFKNTGGGAGPPWLESRLTCLNGPRAGTYAFRRISEGADKSGKEGVTYDMQAGEIWIGEIRVNGAYDIIEPQLFCHATGHA